MTFFESFYIKRYKNKGYRYHLGCKSTLPPPTNTRKSKSERKERFIKLMNKNNWTRAKLSRHLCVNRAWVTKILNGF